MLSLAIAILLQTAPASAEVSGDVDLSCAVQAGGRLQSCVIVKETPTGRGFGDTALRMSRNMSVPAKAGQTVRVPVRFRLSAKEADAMGILPAGSAPLVTDTEPLRRPKAKELNALYPQRGRAADQKGDALVQCVIGGTGRLERCRVLDENPSEYGFGAAAVALAQRFFRYPAKDSQGRQTAGRPLNLVIRFRLAG